MVEQIEQLGYNAESHWKVASLSTGFTIWRQENSVNPVVKW